MTKRTGEHELSFVAIGDRHDDYWNVKNTTDYAVACDHGELCGVEYIKYRRGLLDEGVTLADICLAMQHHNEGFVRGFALAIDRFIAGR